MSQRSVEEIFRSIAPRRRGIPDAPGIAEGVTGNNGDLTTSLSQAGKEIAQLRTSYRPQADLIKSNTQAVQRNTSARGGHPTESTVGNAASGLFGVALGFLSPIISGLSHLFGGGGSAPVTLPIYTPPLPISIGGTLHSAALPGTGQSGGATEAPGPGSGSTTYSPQMTVTVSAMDSQSFMDHSGGIANAVREAMLNNHPIHSVVADL